MKIVSVDVMQVPSGNAGSARGELTPELIAKCNIVTVTQSKRYMS